MNILFLVIKNDITTDRMIRDYDEILLKHFLRAGIGARRAGLSDFIGAGLVLPYLTNLAKLESAAFRSIVVICDSVTAVHFLNIEDTIKNAELRIIRWPIELGTSDGPKLFDTIPQMVEEAKKLLAA